MKATMEQYDEAVEIYQNSKEPVTSVFAFAKIIGVNEWSLCEACDLETPDADCKGENICLCCGSAKGD